MVSFYPETPKPEKDTTGVPGILVDFGPGLKSSTSNPSSSLLLASWGTSAGIIKKAPNPPSRCKPRTAAEAERSQSGTVAMQAITTLYVVYVS